MKKVEDIWVIYNPAADQGRATRSEREILSLISEFSTPKLVKTQFPDHAMEIAQSAIESGCKLVIAVGGDGTVHEIVNGLHESPVSEATLGIVPIGSGNDLASGLGISKDPYTAVQRIFKGQPTAIDLARVEDETGRIRIATNAVGIGFDAAIDIQTKTITRVHGFLMYGLATLRTIAFYYQVPHLRLRFDDESIEQDSLMVAIGLGPRVGGGFYMTPDAVHDDGLLDSCTVNPVGRLTMMVMLPRVMRGTHVTSKHVTMRRSQMIEIQSDIPIPVHIDGEVFAYHEDNIHRLTVTSLPGALNIML